MTTNEIRWRDFSDVHIGYVGSRKWDNYPLLRHALYTVIDHQGLTMWFASARLRIVSGGGGNVDLWAEDHGSKMLQTQPIIHRAVWRPKGVYNPAAGLERNTLIVNDSNLLIAAWDEESNGAYDSIQKALNKPIPTYIVYQDGDIHYYARGIDTGRTLVRGGDD